MSAPVNKSRHMFYLHRALKVFLLLLVLACAVPTSTQQDNAQTDDAPGQSENSSDQQSDQIILSDFIFEHPSVFDKQFPDEMCQDAIPKVTGRQLPIQIFSGAPILPNFFNSECGLMPRAPTRA